MKTVEFLYDFGSPNAFLAWIALGRICARQGANLRAMPVLLGGVFKATNNASPMQSFAGVKGKLDYQRREIARFVERHGITFAFNPAFPINTLTLMRGAVFARDKPWHDEYVAAMFNAMWRDGQNMADAQTVIRVLTEAGLPAQEIVAATADPAVKAELVSLTDDAVRRGVFGAPTMFLAGEMFYGKDSLSDLEWRLERLRETN